MSDKLWKEYENVLVQFIGLPIYIDLLCLCLWPKRHFDVYKW